MKDQPAIPGDKNEPGNPKARQARRSLRLLLLGAFAAGLAGVVALWWLWPRERERERGRAPSAASAPVHQAEGAAFRRFDLPTDKVTIRQVGQGFEIINTDPALTGQEMTFQGVTRDGGTITFTLAIPPPIGGQEEGGAGSE
jgi:hypothetical protein